MENNPTLFDTPDKVLQHFRETGLMPPNYHQPFVDSCIIGIDPGSAGGIAVLTLSGKTLTYDMPDSPKDLFELLKSIKNDYFIMECYLEKVGGMPGNGGARMFNFGQGYGHIEMALISLEIGTTTVSPQAWQKSLLIGTRSGISKPDWKKKLKAKAQQIYPAHKVTLKNADALLICHYVKNLKK